MRRHASAPQQTGLPPRRAWAVLSPGRFRRGRLAGWPKGLRVEGLRQAQQGGRIFLFSRETVNFPRQGLSASGKAGAGASVALTPETPGETVARGSGGGRPGSVGVALG